MVQPDQGSLAQPAATVTLLTGGGDRPYALGLAQALSDAGIHLDFIGSDELRAPELEANPRINFLNLRSSQDSEASARAKIERILIYYWRLLRYCLCAPPRIFHILWNNKFEFFDRVVLMIFYRALKRKIVLTVHNVNRHERDGRDSSFNRLSLKCQYALCHHLFVHTNAMQRQLHHDFGIAPAKITVISFGLNQTVPETSLTMAQARQRLGLAAQAHVLLFFGNIAPYKGLEYLVRAFISRSASDPELRLVIAGRPKGERDYWPEIRAELERAGCSARTVQRIEYVPEEETEIFFKAADALVLPYTHIFQSGVLFLAYNFGLPVLAADVGSLRDEIVAGETGFIFPSRDVSGLRVCIEGYFESELYRELNVRRMLIRDYARERYSWTKVAAATVAVYSRLK